MNLHYKSLPFQITITVLIVVAKYAVTSAALPMQAASLTQSVKATDSSRRIAAATAIDAAAAIHSSNHKQIKANASEASSGSMYLGHLRSAGGYLWLAFLVVPAATLVGLALVVHNDHSAQKDEYKQFPISSRSVSIPSSSQRVAGSFVGQGEGPIAEEYHTAMVSSTGAAQSLLTRSMEVGMSGIPLFFPELMVRDPHGEVLILDGELSREPQEGAMQVRRVVDKAVLFEALISETAHDFHKGILMQQGTTGNEVAFVHTNMMTADGLPCAYIGTSQSAPSFAACIKAGGVRSQHPGALGWEVLALTPTNSLGNLLLRITPARGVDELNISDANGALVAVYTRTQRERCIRLTYGADSIFVVCAALAAIKV